MGASSYVFFGICLLIPLASKFFFRNTISTKEHLLHIVLTLCIASITLYASNSIGLNYMEIWNGQVTKKMQTRVSCEHSYSCNCRTECSGSGKNRSCSEVCDTCYEHSHDYDWDLITNIGRITIDRIDEQGTREPPRWTKVGITEPVSISKSYQNWIKRSDNPLFNKSFVQVPEKIKKLIPEYPGQVYDYYRISRIVPIGKVPLKNKQRWEKHLSMTLRTLGPNRQANVIIVFIDSVDQNMHNYILSKWNGGNKNDIIISVGVPEYPKISWVSVHSLAKKDIFNVSLKNAIMDLKTVPESREFLKVIEKEVMSKFQRQPMAEYKKVLENDISPKPSVLIIALIINILAGIGLTWWFHRENVV